MKTRVSQFSRLLRGISFVMLLLLGMVAAEPLIATSHHADCHDAQQTLAMDLCVCCLQVTTTSPVPQLMTEIFEKIYFVENDQVGSIGHPRALLRPPSRS